MNIPTICGNTGFYGNTVIYANTGNSHIITVGNIVVK